MGDWIWLALLMCPLIMIPMMYMMMKGNHSDHKKHNHPEHVIQEMDQLKKQNEMMLKEIQEMKNTP